MSRAEGVALGVVPEALGGGLTFHAPGEAPPVGKDHQRQLLPVEVFDGLCCFIGRVWEPHLARLLDYLKRSHPDQTVAQDRKRRKTQAHPEGKPSNPC